MQDDHGKPVTFLCARPDGKLRLAVIPGRFRASIALDANLHSAHRMMLRVLHKYQHKSMLRPAGQGKGDFQHQ
ncbi:MAG: hypothetical protein ABSE51_07225 [Terracidiphilus sp.]